MLLAASPYSAVWRRQNKVLKVVRFSSFSTSLGGALREVATLQYLRELLQKQPHPHLMCFDNARFSATELLLTFPAAATDLHQVKGQLTIVQKMTVSAQLLGAVGFLHQHGIIHRDIKPPNVLVNFTAQGAGISVVLTDFGLARFAAHIWSDEMTTSLYTQYYRPLEVLAHLNYGKPADVWALGCTIAELYLTEPLFISKDLASYVAAIVQFSGLPTTPLLANFVQRVLATHHITPIQRVFMPVPPCQQQLLLTLLRPDPDARLVLDSDKPEWPISDKPEWPISDKPEWPISDKPEWQQRLALEIVETIRQVVVQEQLGFAVYWAALSAAAACKILLTPTIIATIINLACQVHRIPWQSARGNCTQLLEILPSLALPLAAAHPLQLLGEQYDDNTLTQLLHFMKLGYPYYYSARQLAAMLQ